MNIIGKILLNKQFNIVGSLQSIETILLTDNGKSFILKKMNDCQYKCLANISIGTLLIKGGIGLVDGIKTMVMLRPVADNIIEVTLKTQLRIELVFVVTIWLSVICYQISGHQNVSLWVDLALFPATLIWFWGVYRFQEQRLQLKIETLLRAEGNLPV
ncbi:MAG: hypothetical protein JWR05_273 [Mucilaginibacter sp.]|nr:hypothetical protein [Mucilaginibacter sp.]